MPMTRGTTRGVCKFKPTARRQGQATGVALKQATTRSVCNLPQCISRSGGPITKTRCFWANRVEQGWSERNSFARSTEAQKGGGMRQGRDPEPCNVRELMCTEKGPGIRPSRGLPGSALGLRIGILSATWQIISRSGLVDRVADRDKSQAGELTAGQIVTRGTKGLDRC
jgi:hypothetical protein